MERDVLLVWDMLQPTSHALPPAELSSPRIRIVIHGLLTIAALFLGAGAILLMRGGDAQLTQNEQVVAPIVSPGPVQQKTSPAIVLPNIDDTKPSKPAIATR
jgi:hypothetical protein